VPPETVAFANPPNELLLLYCNDPFGAPGGLDAAAAVKILKSIGSTVTVCVIEVSFTVKVIGSTTIFALIADIIDT
jgi:hypothetical protein